MASEPDTTTQKLAHRKLRWSLSTVLRDIAGKYYFGDFLELRENSDSFLFLGHLENLKNKYKKTPKLDTDLTSDPLDPIEELVPLDPEDAPLIPLFIELYNDSIAENAPKLENLPGQVMVLGKHYKETVLDPLVESASPFKLKENWLDLYNKGIVTFYDKFLFPVSEDSREFNIVRIDNKKPSIFGLVRQHVKDTLKDSFMVFKNSEQGTQLVDHAKEATTPEIGSDPFSILWPFIRELRIQFYRYWMSVEACCDQDPRSKVRISTEYVYVSEYFQLLTGYEDNYVDTQLNKKLLDKIKGQIISLTNSIGNKTTDEASELLLQSFQKLMEVNAEETTVEFRSSITAFKSMRKLDVIIRRASDSSALATTATSSEASVPLSKTRQIANRPAGSPTTSPPKRSSTLRDRLAQAKKDLDDNKKPLILRPSPIETAKIANNASSSAPSDSKSGSSEKTEGPTSHASKKGERSYSVPSPKDNGKALTPLIDPKMDPKPRKPFFSWNKT